MFIVFIKPTFTCYFVLSDEQKRKEYDNPVTGGSNFNSGFDFGSFNVEYFPVSLRYLSSSCLNVIYANIQKFF